VKGQNRIPYRRSSPAAIGGHAEPVVGFFVTFMNHLTWCHGEELLETGKLNKKSSLLDKTKNPAVSTTTVGKDFFLLTKQWFQTNG
jgi:hypothetical protein